MDLQDLKYPIGAYHRDAEPTNEVLNQWITDLEELPNRLRDTLNTISNKELNYIYRPNGWTIQQVVHHLADSHMNSFIRFKLALTEDTPTIRPYLEDRWARLTDVVDVDISYSLNILTGVHMRLTTLLRSLSDSELNRDFIHPEQSRKLTLRETIGLYAWHSNHHHAHVLQAIKFKGNF